MREFLFNLADLNHADHEEEFPELDDESFDLPDVMGEWKAEGEAEEVNLDSPVEVEVDDDGMPPDDSEWLLVVFFTNILWVKRKTFHPEITIVNLFIEYNSRKIEINYTKPEILI